ncbi:MAG: 4Fe-4S dicluster domain-containing protein, partial [Phycisphaerae bacterium]
KGTETPGPLRPPGSLPEEEFASTCIRCLRCVDACPNHALVSMPPGSASGLGGTPTLQPRRAACMLCAGAEGDTLKCTEVCPSGALQLVKKDETEIQQKVHIGIAQLDLDLCYSYNNWSCGACYRACPLAGAAMTLGAWERPAIHPDACVGCGCCERACIRYPHAIRVCLEAKA